MSFSELHTQKQLMLIYIKSTVEAACTKCGTVEIITNTDESDAAEILMDLGWEATRTHLYCPECKPHKRRR